MTVDLSARAPLPLEVLRPPGTIRVARVIATFIHELVERRRLDAPDSVSANAYVAVVYLPDLATFVDYAEHLDADTRPEWATVTPHQPDAKASTVRVVGRVSNVETWLYLAVTHAKLPSLPTLDALRGCVSADMACRALGDVDQPDEVDVPAQSDGGEQQ